MEKVDDIVKNQSIAVGIGVGVKVEIEVNGESQVWEIVNPGQSDVFKGKISSQAPLIQCILGAKEGDRIRCKIIDNDMAVVVKNISRKYE